MKSDLVRLNLVILSGESRYIPSIFGSVLFKVGTNLDITCDSDILECDYFSDSLHSLTKDLTDENETASLTVSGSAGTREVDLFQDYTTTGNLTFSSSAGETKGLHLLQKLLVRYPLQELQKNLIRERTSLVLEHSLLSMERREIQIQSSWWNYSL